MTTQEIINYYADLLIIQYVGKARAYATIQALVTGTVMDQLPAQVQAGFNLNPTVQTINFSDVAVSGSFQFNYKDLSFVISAGETPEQIQQGDLEGYFGVNAVVVTGSFSDKYLTFSFSDQIPAPSSITVSNNTLVNAGSVSVTTTVTNNIAQGVQLDILGKYAGVVRSGFGNSGPVTLSDADFYRLIQLAVVKNTAGSSLSVIQSLLAQYFPNQILVFDYANSSAMRMAYYVSTTLGSLDLIRLFISEGLLPKPMGVQLGVVAAPVINKFFGLVDYVLNGAAVNMTGFNCVTSYTTGNYSNTNLWLDYSNSLL